MTSSESHFEELEELLHDAVAAVRETPIDESLVKRCRQSAIELGRANDNPRHCTSDHGLSWRVPVTLAASLLILLNVVQAYTRLPSSSRELVAIQESAKVGRLYVYSDLRIDLVPSEQSGHFRSKP